MAKYVIQGETLTEIADGIRTMLGTSSPMDPGGMKTNIDTAQDEVDTQADLIAQIKAELASKAAGTTPADPVLQSKTVTPSAEDQVVAPDPGYGGLTEVTVQGDGDLIPANIKSGVNIFGVLGTFAGSGGGLPSGISALQTGTFTPTEGSTSGVFVTHNLGVVPNFFVWAAEKDLSAEGENAAAVAGAMILKKMKKGPSVSDTFKLVCIACGYDSSGTFGLTSNRIDSVDYMTTTKGLAWTSLTYPIKAGITFRWVCGVLDGIA